MQERRIRDSNACVPIPTPPDKVRQGVSGSRQLQGHFTVKIPTRAHTLRHDLTPPKDANGPKVVPLSGPFVRVRSAESPADDVPSSCGRIDWAVTPPSFSGSRLFQTLARRTDGVERSVCVAVAKPQSSLEPSRFRAKRTYKRSHLDQTFSHGFGADVKSGLRTKTIA